jgi:hypothetical protein
MRPHAPPGRPSESSSTGAAATAAAGGRETGAREHERHDGGWRRRFHDVPQPAAARPSGATRPRTATRVRSVTGGGRCGSSEASGRTVP